MWVQGWLRPQCGGWRGRGPQDPALGVRLAWSRSSALWGLEVSVPPSMPAAMGGRERRGHLPPQLPLASAARNWAPGQDGNCGPGNGTALASAGGWRVVKAGDGRCSRDGAHSSFIHQAPNSAGNRSGPLPPHPCTTGHCTLCQVPGRGCRAEHGATRFTSDAGQGSRLAPARCRLGALRESRGSPDLPKVAGTSIQRAPAC